MNNDARSNILWILILTFSSLLPCVYCQGSRRIVLINLGGQSLSASGNTWQNDTYNQGVPQTPANTSRPIVSAKSASESMYKDSVFVSHPDVLNFTIPFDVPSDQARIFLRLHFAAYPTANYSDPTSSYFDVYSLGFKLLSNFSIVEKAYSQLDGDTGLYVAVFMEFSLPFPTGGSSVDIALLPANGSFASIAGLEILSIPDTLYNVNGSTYFMSTNSRRSLPPSLGMALLYRIKCGNGGIVSPLADYWNRTWLEDSNYLRFVGGPSSSATNVPLDTDVPPYYTPSLVAQNSRQSTVNPVGYASNISFVFQGSGGLTYFLRLHFCDNTVSTPGTRVMRVIVNGAVALTNIDLVASVGEGHATAFDVLVPLPSQTLQGSIFIDIQSYFQYTDTEQFYPAIISGVELFLVGDKDLSHTNQYVAPADPEPEAGSPPPLPPPPGSTSPPPLAAPRPSSPLSVIVLVGAALGIALLLLLLLASLLFCYCCFKNSDRKPSDDAVQLISEAKEKEGQPGTFLSLLDTLNKEGASNTRAFSLQEILVFTSGFSDSLLIGYGGFGKVYQGSLPDGAKVAVKRASQNSAQGKAEFEAELLFLSRLSHPNLVALVGVCTEGNELILVYEFVPLGTFRSHIYGSSRPAISWAQRLEVLIGAANALHYLHFGSTVPVIHRDVKSTNILLDEDLKPKVADFGLSRVGPTLEETHVSTAVKGSFGYLDPDYFRRQQLTEKSDVYSFGVVMLEALCSRLPINPSLPRVEANLVDWALPHISKGDVYKIVDDKLIPFSLESIQQFAALAAKCLLESGVQRPSMAAVSDELQQVLQIQKLHLSETPLLDSDGANPAEESGESTI